MGRAPAVTADGCTAEAATRRIATGIRMNYLSFIGEGYRCSLPSVRSALSFAENQQIYNEGSEAVSVFKVASGMVRTCTFLRNGRRQIDAFYVPGNVFGIELGAAHSLSAEPVCNSTVVSYRRRELQALAATNEEFSHQLFSYAMESLARAQRHAVLLGRRSALEKLAAFLLDWAVYSPSNNVVILEMPRRDIADYLGLTIETVSRAFAHLEARTLIEIPAARLIRLKNPQGLSDLNF